MTDIELATSHETMPNQQWSSEDGDTLGDDDAFQGGRHPQPRNTARTAGRGASTANSPPGEVEGGSQYGRSICRSTAMSMLLLPFWYPPVDILRFSGLGRLTVPPT